MLTETRKASPSRADDLALYALAQARAEEVTRACEQPCKGCPGPGEEGGCETRSYPKAVAGRADWPACPLGMLRAPAWRSIVDAFVSAKVSPLSGWPDSYTAFAHEGMLELHAAVRREDERRIQSASSGSSSGGPSFSGRRVARGGGG